MTLNRIILIFLIFLSQTSCGQKSNTLVCIKYENWDRNTPIWIGTDSLELHKKRTVSSDELQVNEKTVSALVTYFSSNCDSSQLKPMKTLKSIFIISIFSANKQTLQCRIVKDGSEDKYFKDLFDLLNEPDTKHDQERLIDLLKPYLQS